MTSQYIKLKAQILQQIILWLLVVSTLWVNCSSYTCMSIHTYIDIDALFICASSTLSVI